MSENYQGIIEELFKTGQLTQESYQAYKAMADTDLQRAITSAITGTHRLLCGQFASHPAAL